MSCSIILTIFDLRSCYGCLGNSEVNGCFTDIIAHTCDNYGDSTGTCKVTGYFIATLVADSVIDILCQLLANSVIANSDSRRYRLTAVDPVSVSNRYSNIFNVINDLGRNGEVLGNSNSFVIIALSYLNTHCILPCICGHSGAICISRLKLIADSYRAGCICDVNSYRLTVVGLVRNTYIYSAISLGNGEALADRTAVVSLTYDGYCDRTRAGEVIGLLLTALVTDGVIICCNITAIAYTNRIFKRTAGISLIGNLEITSGQRFGSNYKFKRNIVRCTSCPLVVSGICQFQNYIILICIFTALIRNAIERRCLNVCCLIRSVINFAADGGYCYGCLGNCEFSGFRAGIVALTGDNYGDSTGTCEVSGHFTTTLVANIVVCLRTQCSAVKSNGNTGLILTTGVGKVCRGNSYVSIANALGCNIECCSF